MAGLLTRSAYLFSARIYADGDFAANALLIDRALRWQLLTGNYSRVGFHHPGPAFLYVEAWSEWLFHDVLGVVPTSFNAHVVGILILNAALLGAAAHLFYVHQRSVIVTAAGFATIAVFLASQPYVLSSVWMPYVYVTPFLLFATASASFAAGRWTTLPWLTFSGALLVHGHVAFLGFVGPAVTVLALVAWLRHRRPRAAFGTIWRVRSRPITLAGVIAAVFALPIAINVAWNFPGDFGRYLEYLRSGQAGHHSATAVIRYGLEYWGSGPGRHAVTGVLVAAALGLVLADPDREVRRFAIGVLATGGLLSLLFLNYGLRGIDDLTERYIGQFYVAIPALVLGVVAMAATRRVLDSVVPRHAAAGRGVSIAVLVIAALSLGTTTATSAALNFPYRGDPTLPSLHGMLRRAPERSGHPIVLSFSTTTWPVATGLMYYADHNGLRVCAADDLWEFLVTSDFVCSPAERRRGWHLEISARGDVPAGPLVYEDARFVITGRQPNLRQ